MASHWVFSGFLIREVNLHLYSCKVVLPIVKSAIHSKWNSTDEELIDNTLVAVSFEALVS